MSRRKSFDLDERPASNYEETSDLWYFRSSTPNQPRNSSEPRSAPPVRTDQPDEITLHVAAEPTCGGSFKAADGLSQTELLTLGLQIEDQGHSQLNQVTGVETKGKQVNVELDDSPQLLIVTTPPDTQEANANLCPNTNNYTETQARGNAAGSETNSTLSGDVYSKQTTEESGSIEDGVPSSLSMSRTQSEEDPEDDYSAEKADQLSNEKLEMFRKRYAALQILSQFVHESRDKPLPTQVSSPITKISSLAGSDVPLIPQSKLIGIPDSPSTSLQTLATLGKIVPHTGPDSVANAAATQASSQLDANQDVVQTLIPPNPIRSPSDILPVPRGLNAVSLENILHRRALQEPNLAIALATSNLSDLSQSHPENAAARNSIGEEPQKVESDLTSTAQRKANDDPTILTSTSSYISAQGATAAASGTIQISPTLSVRSIHGQAPSNYHNGIPSAKARQAQLMEVVRTQYDELFNEDKLILQQQQQGLVDDKGAPKWNDMFIKAVESETDRYHSLTQLSSNFLQTASTYASMIIEEFFLTDRYKTVRLEGLGGLAGGQKFIVRGLLFKVPRDKLVDPYKTRWLYGGKTASLECAMKAMGKELLGAIQYSKYLRARSLNYKTSKPHSSEPPNVVSSATHRTLAPPSAKTVTPPHHSNSVSGFDHDSNRNQSTGLASLPAPSIVPDALGPGRMQPNLRTRALHRSTSAESQSSSRLHANHLTSSGSADDGDAGSQDETGSSILQSSCRSDSYKDVGEYESGIPSADNPYYINEEGEICNISEYGDRRRDDVSEVGDYSQEGQKEPPELMHHSSVGGTPTTRLSIRRGSATSVELETSLSKRMFDASPSASERASFTQVTLAPGNRADTTVASPSQDIPVYVDGAYITEYAPTSEIDASAHQASDSKAAQLTSRSRSTGTSPQPRAEISMQRSSSTGAYAPFEEVFVPMQALVDYRGFRLLAMPLLPITRATLHVGSGDGGATVHAKDAPLLAALHDVAKEMHLADHLIAGTNVSLPCAGDVEGHVGLDGRRYLVDLGRALPPECSPLSSHLPQRGQTAFYRFLRPELLQHLKLREDPIRFPPLSPDAFSRWGRQEGEKHENAAANAALLMLHEQVPKFAHYLANQLTPPHLLAKACRSLNVALHRAGINCRHLGLVRASLRYSEPLEGVNIVALMGAPKATTADDLSHASSAKAFATNLLPRQSESNAAAFFLPTSAYNDALRMRASILHFLSQDFALGNLTPNVNGSDSCNPPVLSAFTTSMRTSSTAALTAATVRAFMERVPVPDVVTKVMDVTIYSPARPVFGTIPADFKPQKLANAVSFTKDAQGNLLPSVLVVGNESRIRAARTSLLVEMTARSLKNLLRRRLRNFHQESGAMSSFYQAAESVAAFLSQITGAHIIRQKQSLLERLPIFRNNPLLSVNQDQDDDVLVCTCILEALGEDMGSGSTSSEPKLGATLDPPKASHSRKHKGSAHHHHRHSKERHTVRGVGCESPYCRVRFCSIDSDFWLEEVLPDLQRRFGPLAAEILPEDGYESLAQAMVPHLLRLVNYVTSSTGIRLTPGCSEACSRPGKIINFAFHACDIEAFGTRIKSLTSIEQSRANYMKEIWNSETYHELRAAQAATLLRERKHHELMEKLRLKLQQATLNRSMQPDSSFNGQELKLQARFNQLSRALEQYPRTLKVIEQLSRRYAKSMLYLAIKDLSAALTGDPWNDNIAIDKTVCQAFFFELDGLPRNADFLLEREMNRLVSQQQKDLIVVGQVRDKPQESLPADVVTSLRFAHVKQVQRQAAPQYLPICPTDHSLQFLILPRETSINQFVTQFSEYSVESKARLVFNQTPASTKLIGQKSLERTPSKPGTLIQPKPIDSVAELFQLPVPKPTDSTQADRNLPLSKSTPELFRAASFTLLPTGAAATGLSHLHINLRRQQSHVISPINLLHATPIAYFSRPASAGSPGESELPDDVDRPNSLVAPTRVSTSHTQKERRRRNDRLIAKLLITHVKLMMHRRSVPALQYRRVTGFVASAKVLYSCYMLSVLVAATANPATGGTRTKPIPEADDAKQLSLGAESSPIDVLASSGLPDYAGPVPRIPLTLSSIGKVSAARTVGKLEVETLRSALAFLSSACERAARYFLDLASGIDANSRIKSVGNALYEYFTIGNEAKPSSQPFASNPSLVTSFTVPLARPSLESLTEFPLPGPSERRPSREIHLLPSDNPLTSLLRQLGVSPKHTSRDQSLSASAQSHKASHADGLLPLSSLISKATAEYLFHDGYVPSQSAIRLAQLSLLRVLNTTFSIPEDLQCAWVGPREIWQDSTSDGQGIIQVPPRQVSYTLSNQEVFRPLESAGLQRPAASTPDTPTLANANHFKPTHASTSHPAPGIHRKPRPHIEALSLAMRLLDALDRAILAHDEDAAVLMLTHFGFAFDALHQGNEAYIASCLATHKQAVSRLQGRYPQEPSPAFSSPTAGQKLPFGQPNMPASHPAMMSQYSHRFVPPYVHSTKHVSTDAMTSRRRHYAATSDTLGYTSGAGRPAWGDMRESLDLDRDDTDTIDPSTGAKLFVNVFSLKMTPGGSVMRTINKSVAYQTRREFESAPSLYTLQEMSKNAAVPPAKPQRGGFAQEVISKQLPKFTTPSQSLGLLPSVRHDSQAPLLSIPAYYDDEIEAWTMRHDKGPAKHHESASLQDVVDFDSPVYSRPYVPIEVWPLFRYVLQHALHAACAEGCRLVVQALLAEAADEVARTELVCSENHLGYSGLFIATKRGDVPIVQALLSARAKVQTEVAAESGRSPLHVACLHSDKSIAFELCSLLLGAGAVCNAKDHLSLTPLHYACRAGHLEVVQLLIGARADVNALDLSHLSPLYYALEGNHLDIAQTLLQAHADYQHVVYIAATRDEQQIISTLQALCGIKVQDWELSPDMSPHRGSSSSQDTNNVRNEEKQIASMGLASPVLNSARFHPFRRSISVPSTALSAATPFGNSMDHSDAVKDSKFESKNDFTL